jgi:hypothetical protein
MKRRNLLAAVAAGGIGAMLVANGANAGTILTDGSAAVVADPAAVADETVEPQYGAGLFDVDPDQGGISQSPDVVVTGDVSVLSEDMEL